MSILPTGPTRNAPSRSWADGPTAPGSPWNFIYHSGALGDFITTFPALVVWTHLHSPQRTVLLTRRTHGVLSLQAALVDETWDLDEARFAGLFGGDGSTLAPPPPNRALLFSSLDSPLVDALRNADCRHLTVQPPFPDTPQPIISYHLSLFPHTPPPAVLFQPLRDLGTSRLTANGMAEVFRDAVLIHPGSGGRRKNWPARRFVEVARILRRKGQRVTWCLGQAENDFRPPGVDAVLSESALADLCAAFTVGRCYLGNDSGVSHLAAACGCPSVVLFGPSDDRIWAPRGDAVEIVTPPCKTEPGEPREIRDIQTSQVLIALDRLL